MRKIAPLIPLAAGLALAASCAKPAPPPATPPVASAKPAPPPGPKVEKVSLASVGLDAKAIDHSVDPCQDFYQFACGNWIKNTKIPGDRSRWVRSFNVIHKKNEQVLRKILQDAEKAEKSEKPGLQKLGNYYAACMDEKAVEKAGLKPIKPLLAKAKHLGSVKAISALVTELHKDGIWALFDVSSDQDFKDATRYIAYLDQDGLGLPDRDYYTKQDAKSKEIRKKYQEHVAAMMTLAGWNKHAAEQAARDVMEVETDLAEISKTKVQRRDPKSLYNPVDRKGVEKLASHFEWNRYFDGLGFPKIENINVTSKKFFSGMNELLTKVSMPKWRNYFAWQIINAMAPALPKKFVDENFKMRQVLTGQKEQKPRWKRCVASTDAELGELLAQPFVKQRFGGDSKAFALKLVHAIGKAFVKDVGTLDWMDPATKQRAREKFEAMAYLIGYPNKWKKYPFKVDPDDYAANVLRGQAWEVQRQLKRIGKPVDRGEWEMTPPTVNAYYTAAEEPDGLPGRHPAAALLRREGDHPGEPGRHGHGGRPRADTRLRRRGLAVRQERQPRELVDARGEEAVQGQDGLHREGVQQVRSGPGRARERQAHPGREHRRQRWHQAGLQRVQDAARGRQDGQGGRRLHRGPAVLPGDRADLVQQAARGDRPHAGPGRSAFAAALAGRRLAREPSRVRRGLLLQGRHPHAPEEHLLRLVAGKAGPGKSGPGSPCGRLGLMFEGPGSLSAPGAAG